MPGGEVTPGLGSAPTLQPNPTQAKQPFVPNAADLEKPKTREELAKISASLNKE